MGEPSIHGTTIYLRCESHHVRGETLLAGDID